MVKKGMISIWVIVGVILAGSILLFFAISKGPDLIKPAEGEAIFDMQSYLEECTTEYVEEVVEQMLSHGGFVNPKNTVFFDETEIEYICKDIGFYKPCIHQHPMFLKEMKKEIGNEIYLEMLGCFDSMEREFSRRGHIELGSTPLFIGIGLGSDRIFVKLEKEVEVEKQGETRTFEEFNVEVKSPLYNLASVAVEIAAQESKNCYFEFVGYSLLHPRYEIRKYGLSDQTKVYTIKDRESGKVMNTAVRGCAIPGAY